MWLLLFVDGPERNQNAGVRLFLVVFHFPREGLDTYNWGTRIVLPIDRSASSGRKTASAPSTSTACSRTSSPARLSDFFGGVLVKLGSARLSYFFFFFVFSGFLFGVLVKPGGLWEGGDFGGLWGKLRKVVGACLGFSSGGFSGKTVDTLLDQSSYNLGLNLPIVHRSQFSCWFKDHKLVASSVFWTPLAKFFWERFGQLKCMLVKEACRFRKPFQHAVSASPKKLCLVAFVFACL